MAIRDCPKCGNKISEFGNGCGWCADIESGVSQPTVETEIVTTPGLLDDQVSTPLDVPVSEEIPDEAPVEDVVGDESGEDSTVEAPEKESLNGLRVQAPLVGRLASWLSVIIPFVSLGLVIALPLLGQPEIVEMGGALLSIAGCIWAFCLSLFSLICGKSFRHRGMLLRSVLGFMLSVVIIIFLGFKIKTEITKFGEAGKVLESYIKKMPQKN